MAKKSFTNPANQFISGIEAAQAKTDLQEAFPEMEEELTPTAQQEAEPIIKLPTSAKAPKGYKLNPAYIETKTRRLQLVLQPSLYNRIKKAAKKQKLSVNEYIHRTLDNATD